MFLIPVCQCFWIFCFYKGAAKPNYSFYIYNLYECTEQKCNFTSVKNVSPHIDTYSLEETGILTSADEPCNLIVWNDEVNTFEWVIETLVDVCGHTEEQAEQCAYIIHFRGKYAVKNGNYDDLKPQCDAITERGINATVEIIAG